MPRNALLSPFILEELKEGELNWSELKKRVRKHHDGSGDSFRKMYNSALFRLLNNGYIYIVGYDFPLDKRKQPQAFIPDFFIFKLMKKDISEIRYLIKQSDSPSLGEVMDASHELRELFRNKIKEIEAENEIKWNRLVSRVYFREPTNEELLWYYANDMLVTDEKYSSLTNIHAPHDVIRDIMRDNSDNIEEIKEQYPELTLYLLKGHQIEKDSHESIPSSITEEYLFSNGNAEDEILNKISYKPGTMRNSAIDDLFYKTTAWIMSQEKEKSRYLEYFATALSDMDESKEKMDELIFKAVGERIIFQSPS